MFESSKINLKHLPLINQYELVGESPAPGGKKQREQQYQYQEYQHQQYKHQGGQGDCEEWAIKKSVILTKGINAYNYHKNLPH